MALPLIPVSTTIYDQSGNPIANALIEMRLNGVESYNSLVVPESFTTRTDENGSATINVFPNALGSQGSFYKVIITTPDRTIRGNAVVPNAACSLYEIMQLQPYPSRSLVESATISAAQFRDLASSYATSAYNYLQQSEVLKNNTETNSISAAYYGSLALSSATSAYNYSLSASASQVLAAASAAAAEEAASQLENLDIYKPKGTIDASSNPNFPTGEQGDFYIISVAGKVGGASGIAVSVSDMVMCLETSPGGDFAAVGGNWAHIVNNLDGIVLGPSLSVVDNLPSFNTTNGKLIKDSGVAISDVARVSNLGTFATLSNPLSAKGDLLVHTGTTLTRFAPSANDLTLISDNTTSTGWKLGVMSSGGSSKWTDLAAGTNYNTTGASTSTITMLTDKTSVIFPGMALRYKVSGTYYYGICGGMTSNLLTVHGDPLTTDAGAITELAYGLIPPIQMEIFVPGYWGDAAETALIQNDLNMRLTWRLPPSKLVKFIANTRIQDSGAAKERVNVRIGSTTTDYTITSNSNNGLEPSINFGNMQTTVQFDTSKNSVSYGSIVELKVQGNGTNKDSVDLQATLIFVVK